MGTDLHGRNSTYTVALSVSIRQATRHVQLQLTLAWLGIGIRLVVAALGTGGTSSGHSATAAALPFATAATGGGVLSCRVAPTSVRAVVHHGL